MDWIAQLKALAMPPGPIGLSCSSFNACREDEATARYFVHFFLGKLQARVSFPHRGKSVRIDISATAQKVSIVVHVQIAQPQGSSLFSKFCDIEFHGYESFPCEYMFSPFDCLHHNQYLLSGTPGR